MLEDEDKKFIFEFSKEFDKFLNLYKEEKKRNANFMSKLSHEIKNPLTIIKSSLQLLEKQIEGSYDKCYLESVYDEINFIDDILTQISNYGKSAKRMSFETVSIGNLVKCVAKSYLSIAEKEKKLLKVDIRQPWVNIRCDATSIRQVLTNLVKNAMEATNEGDRILISVKTVDKTVVIKVQDTGMGIDDERLGTIFEPFVTTKSCGTGLGLSVVKNLIEAHQGTIEVESEFNKGTTFTIKLPIDSDNITT